VLGQLAVGAYQVFRSGAQPTVGYVDLFDERVVAYRLLLSSTAVSVLPVL
jgi:hypothetical protein